MNSGKLWAQNQLTLTTPQLTLNQNAVIGSNHQLCINSTNSYTHTIKLYVPHLTITTKGNLINQGLISADHLLLQANNIHNQANRFIITLQDLQLQAHTIQNDKNSHIDSQGTLTLANIEDNYCNRITNNMGYIQSKGDMTLKAHYLDNQCGDQSGSYYTTQTYQKNLSNNSDFCIKRNKAIQQNNLKTLYQETR